jgi:hypothetical protein
MPNELKSCPFCGGKINIVSCNEDGDIIAFGKYLGIEHTAEDNALCPIALYRGKIMGEQIYSDKAEVAEFWNRRADNA